MKRKLLVLSLIIVLSVFMIMSFSFYGCKTTTTTEEAAIETAASIETTAAATTAAATTASSKPIVIKKWGWGDNVAFKALETEIAKRINEKYPNVTFETSSYSATEYYQVLKTAIAGGEAPDLTFNTPGTEIKQMADAGTILELGAIIKADPEWDALTEVQRAYGDYWYDGKEWGVFPAIAHLAQLYWKDMFPNGFPETVDQMYVEADRLNAEGIIPVTVGLVDKWGISDIFVIYASQYDPDPNRTLLGKEDRGEVSWINDTNKAALTKIKEMWDRGVWSEESYTFSFGTDCYTQFMNRKAASITPAAGWMIGTLVENNIDLSQIGISYMPIAEEGFKITAINGLSSGVSLMAGSKNQDMAIEVLKMYAQPWAREIIYDNGFETFAFPGMENKNPDVLFKLCMETLAKTPPTYRYINTPELAAAIQEIVPEVCLGTLTIDQALAKVQEVSDSLYK